MQKNMNGILKLSDEKTKQNKNKINKAVTK